MPLPDPSTPTPPDQSAPQETSPLGFQDLYNLHQSFTQANPQFKDLSLHDFSDLANKATGTQRFSQGLNDGWVRDLVAEKNNFIKPVTDVAQGIGDSIDQVLGTSTTQGGTSPVGEAFKSIPETVANLAVVAAPTIADPFGGEAGSAAIAGPVFGASGALNTYGETGSALAAGVSGAAGYLLPGSGKLGADLAGQTVNKYLGREAVEGGQNLLPGISPVLGKLADYVGANAGIIANQNLANVAVQGAVGGLPAALDAAKHIASVDNVLGSVAGVLPFAGFDAATGHFSHPTKEGEYNNTAQFYRDQENLQRSQALADSIKENYFKTATSNTDVENLDKTPPPLTPEQVEQNLNLVPSGKSAAESAQQMKLGDVNGIVGSREGAPYKSAAESASTIAEKYQFQDEPDKTLFQQPIPSEQTKSAEESAQAMQARWSEEQAYKQGPQSLEDLNAYMSGREVPSTQGNATNPKVGKSAELSANRIADLEAQRRQDALSSDKYEAMKLGLTLEEYRSRQPALNPVLSSNFDFSKGGDITYDEYGKQGQEGEGGNQPQNRSVGIQGLEPERGDGSGQGGQAEVGRTRDDLETGIGDGGKGDDKPLVPLTLTPEVVEMAKVPPASAEDAQKMMQTNNTIIDESNSLRTSSIRNRIQTSFDFENADMQPFTDEWITDHYQFNKDQGMTDGENYKDILDKAQGVFRDNVNKVNSQLLQENDRRVQARAESNKQTQKGKQTFQDRVQSLGEDLNGLKPEERQEVEGNISSILKEKGSGQYTQGEANVYEAASAIIKKRKQNPEIKLPSKGQLAAAYELGKQEEQRHVSSTTGETEVNEKGETVKVRKSPLSINAPIAAEGHQEFGDLQHASIVSMPDSSWVDKEAERLQPSNPTAQETQRAMIIKRVNNALDLLKKGGDQRVLDAFRAAATKSENRKLGIPISPRQPEVAIQKLFDLAHADMLKLTDHELVGNVIGEGGKPLSEESIHGERAKARAVLAELINKMGEDQDKLKVIENRAKTPMTDEVRRGKLLEAVEKLIEQQKNIQVVGQGTEISLQQTTKEFFTQFANKLGLSGQEHKTFVDTAQRIALAMASSDKVKLGELEPNFKPGERGFGVMAQWERGGNFAQFIGVLKDPFVLAKLLKTKSLLYTKFFSLFNLAHEVSHTYDELRGVNDPKNAAQNAAFTKLEQMANTMSEDEKRTMLQELFKMTVPKVLWGNNDDVKKAMESTAVYSSHTTSEFLATLNGLVHVGMATRGLQDRKAQDFKEYITFSSAAMQDFSRGAYLNLMKYSNAIEAFWRGGTENLKEKTGIDNSKWADVLHEAITFQKDFGRIPEEMNKKIEQLSNIKTNYPGVYLDHLQKNTPPLPFKVSSASFIGPDGSIVKAAMNKAAEDIGLSEKTPEELFKKQAGMWNLMTSGHWAQKFPEMADVMELAHSFPSIVNEYISRALSPFLTSFDARGNLVRDTQAKGIKELVNNPKAHEALNNIFRWQNANDSKLAPDEIVKQFTSGLTPRLSKMVEHYRDAMSKSMSDMATKIVAGKQSDMVKAAARLIQGENPTLKYNDYMGIANQLVGAKLSAGSSDSQTAAMANAKLMQMMATASPGLMAANRLTDALIPEFSSFRKQFLDRPGYTSETRQGPYMVSWKELQPDGTMKPFTTGFKDKKSATDRYNKAQRDGKSIDLKAYDRNATGASTEGVTNAAVEALTRFDNAAFKAAMQLAPEAAADFQKYFQSGEGLLKEMQSRGYRKNLMTRKLVGGREELDVFQQAFNYVQSMSRGLAKQEVRGQLMLRSNEAKVLAEPNLRNDAIGHVENTINPPVAEYNKLKEGIFQYFLGGNLSSLVVDASHPVLSLAPFLIEKGSGISGAYKNMAYAGAKVATALSKGSLSKASTFEDFQRLVGDKDLAQGLFKAKQERLLDHGILDEFRTSDDLDLLNLRATATDQGSVFGNTSALLQNAAYQYLRATRQLFGTVSKYNNLNTYIASFKTARDQGNSVDDSHSFAAKAVNTVLPQGGRGSRPVFFSKLGKAQSLFGVMYSLQSYTTGLLSMHARLAADSLGQSGLTGVPLSNARKALATAVLSQVALSGVLGLPFVGATVALLQNIFPELKASQFLRETLHSLGGADSNLGDSIADAGLKGLPAMIAGVDLSGRLGLGNILGTNPYNGFDASALLGPTGSLVEKMVLGMGDLVQGNIQGAAENVMPVAYKNLLDAYAFDKVGRDKDGNMLTAPTDATRFLSAVGLKTTAETDARDEQGMLRQSARANAVELKSFYNQVADQIATGNMEEAKTLLYARSQQDPSFSPQAGVKAAVQVLQDRQAPKDMLSRVGLTNSEDAGKIAALFPPQAAQQSNEFQSEMQKSMLERSVGIPGVGMTPQSKLKEAQAVDYLVDSYGVSPSQARAMLSHTIDARQKLGQRQQAWEQPVSPVSQ